MCDFSEGPSTPSTPAGDPEVIPTIELRDTSLANSGALLMNAVVFDYQHSSSQDDVLKWNGLNYKESWEVCWATGLNVFGILLHLLTAGVQIMNASRNVQNPSLVWPAD